MMTNLYEIPVEKQEHEIVKRTNNYCLNRAINALLRNGFKTWEEVNKSKIEDLMNVRGLSRNGIKWIIRAMNDLGI